MASASFSAAASVPSGPVSLSLAKISYCTTALHASTMTWTHVPNRDGIFAVFDTIRRREIDGSVTELRMLKIVNKSEQLDQINLDTLREQASIEGDRSLYDEDKRVIVLVKKPLLALRFPLPGGQIRRLQLNFRPESGFDYAVNTLQLFDLPIRFKDATSTSVGRNPRPHSAQAAVSSTIRQASHHPFNRTLGSRDYASVASIPSAPPLLPFASTNTSTPYQRGLPLSGINQDDISRPLLAHQPPSGWEGSLAFASQHSQPPVGALNNDPLDQSIDDATGHHSIPSVEAPNGTWQWIPNKGEQARPTTAPAKTSARLAQDTMTLSQMLPPDRMLPFPEKIESRPSSQISKARKSIEQLPETTYASRVTAKYTENPKAKKTRKDRRGSSLSRSSLTPSRASSQYNLRPGSSSSNVGMSRPGTSDSTLLSDPAKALARDRLTGSKTKLFREGWRLGEADFLHKFNEEAFANNAFLEELIKFARIESDFAAAYSLLVKAQSARRIQTPREHKVRVWTANDVKNAMKLRKDAVQEKREKPVQIAQANTPRKRIRAVSPFQIAQKVRRPSRESTQDTTADETPTRLVPADVNAKSAAISKRRAASLDIDTGSANPEGKPADHEPAPPLAPKKQQTTAPPPDTQLQLPTTQPHLPHTPEQQIMVTSTPTAPPKLQPPHPASPSQPTPLPTTTPDPPACINLAPNPILNTTTPPIITTAVPPQADLIHLLNTWATTSPLFKPPPILPQSSKELLADFASKDDETRVQVLDEMICECLEDENFSSLVQDVERAWRRIGLGL